VQVIVTSRKMGLCASCEWKIRNSLQDRSV